MARAGRSAAEVRLLPVWSGNANLCWGAVRVDGSDAAAGHAGAQMAPARRRSGSNTRADHHAASARRTDGSAREKESVSQKIRPNEIGMNCAPEYPNVPAS